MTGTASRSAPRPAAGGLCHRVAETISFRVRYNLTTGPSVIRAPRQLHRVVAD